MGVHRQAGAKAYATRRLRDDCPFSLKEPDPRAAWLEGYDGARSKDAPEPSEPENFDDNEEGEQPGWVGLARVLT